MEAAVSNQSRLSSVDRVLMNFLRRPHASFMARSNQTRKRGIRRSKLARRGTSTTNYPGWEAEGRQGSSTSQLMGLPISPETTMILTSKYSNFRWRKIAAGLTLTMNLSARVLSRASTTSRGQRILTIHSTTMVMGLAHCQMIAA